MVVREATNTGTLLTTIDTEDVPTVARAVVLLDDGTVPLLEVAKRPVPELSNAYPAFTVGVDTVNPSVAYRLHPILRRKKKRYIQYIGIYGRRLT